MAHYVYSVVVKEVVDFGETLVEKNIRACAPYSKVTDRFDRNTFYQFVTDFTTLGFNVKNVVSVELVDVVDEENRTVGSDIVEDLNTLLESVS